MKKNPDILENRELREVTFKVPEGYFDGLAEKMVRKIGGQAEETPVTRRLVPYLAMAAAFLVLVAGGTFFLRHFTPEGPFVTADNVSEIVETDITSDDIVAYLIYSEASLEEFSDLLDE